MLKPSGVGTRTVRSSTTSTAKTPLQAEKLHQQIPHYFLAPAQCPKGCHCHVGAIGQAEASMASTTCLSKSAPCLRGGILMGFLKANPACKPTQHHPLPRLRTLHSARLPAFSLSLGRSRSGTHPSGLIHDYGPWTLHLLGNMFMQLRHAGAFLFL